MRGIFISYRRDDAEGQAGRLFDDLSSHFGHDAVFMDVAGIKKGLDFRRIIDEHVTSCGVLLVIIGKRWLSTTDSKGKRRLDDANDFVRLETAAALSRDIPVVPVLVHDAVMPTEQELPDALKELAFRNGTELTHARWESDVKLLIEDLRPYLDLPAVGEPSARPARDQPAVASAQSMPPGSERRTAGRSPWLAAGAVVMIAAGSTIGYHLWQGRPAPDIPAVAAVQSSPVAEVRGPASAIAAPPAAARPPVKDESGKFESMPVQIDAAKAAAAQASAARAAVARAAARKAAEEQRQREAAERSAQLAEEQRKRDEETRRIAQEQAEKSQVAAEQAAGAKIFTDIATSIISNRQNNRR
jgi:hypothetical protein